MDWLRSGVPTLSRRRWVCGLAALSLVACPPKKGTEDGGTGGSSGVADACNSLEEALTLAECALTLGKPMEAYIGHSGDMDWYSFTAPATLTARSLLHVRASYTAANTAVNLTVNVLRSDGTTSLFREVDQHGQLPPKPVDILRPFTEKNARLVLLISDEGKNPKALNFDDQAPYTLVVDFSEDPDANEPNDTTPTPVALSPQGAALAGSATGVLATAGDVDRFSFLVPTPGRKVLYVHLTAPHQVTPPPFRLQYVLSGPDGKPIFEDKVANEYLDVNLATARLSPGVAAPPNSPNQYQVAVSGYVGANSPTVAPGSVDLQYTLEVKVFDEVDTNEPNDTWQDAAGKAFTFTAPGKKVFTGRLGYVPDPDYFAVDLAPTPLPTVLRFKVTPSGVRGRFDPLPGLVDRETHVYTQVTGGATPQANVTTCKTDRNVCPKGVDPRDRPKDGGVWFLQGLVDGYCSSLDPANPPLCLWAYRVETDRQPSLRNFEGRLPVAPHPQNARYLIEVLDDGTNWADDQDYVLEVEWLSDPDEAARYAGGAVEQPAVSNLFEDPSPNANLVPPQTGALNGTLSHGPSILYRLTSDAGEPDVAIRGHLDYDAVLSDVDTFELHFPAVDPDAGLPLDRTWELEWSVANVDGGYVHDLALDLVFCDGDVASDAGCAQVAETSGGGPLSLVYEPGEKYYVWYNVGGSYYSTGGPETWGRSAPGGSATTSTAKPEGCFCFEPRFVRGGKFYLKATAIDRVSYAEAPYVIRTAVTSYPRPFAYDGGLALCPAPTPVGDGGWTPGCRFTEEP